MLRNLGTHLHHLPSGRWGFVGTLPTSLGKIVPATTADVLGLRAWRNEAGNLVTWRFPAFDSEEAARKFAADAGVKLAN